MRKRFSEMTVAAEGIVKYTVQLCLNGTSTQAIFDSLYEVLDYLDYLVETGGDVTNIQISEGRKLFLE